jgi:thiol reductant ABC exporter CydD subunit
VKPLDQRLLHQSRAARQGVLAASAITVAGAVLLVVQAFTIADIVTKAFQGGDGVPALRTPLLVLGCVALARGGLAWASDVATHRAAAGVKSQLRRDLLARIVQLGPSWLSQQRTGELATLVTRGTDALDGYFARYLPALLSAVVVPPLVIVVILSQDLVSGVIVILTVPLIPLFAALIGKATERRSRRSWQAITVLASHFLDVVDGLPTLLVFRRASAQVDTIREVTDENRQATMSTLRLAFLSSAALEFVTTISVALVAVSAGLRLVDARMDLRTALVVIILTPEAYWPLRQAGAQFHASADGLAVADQVFAVLDKPPATRAPRVGTVDLSEATIRLEQVIVAYDRAEPALGPLDLTIHPGELLGISGPSGCGKSTLIAVLMGFVAPTSGRVLIDCGDRIYDLADLEPAAWRAQVSWLPQTPWLAHASIAENVRLARPSADDDQVAEALAAAGAEEFVAQLPEGVDTLVGEGGFGLSAGQRQRLAVARALLRDAPLVLLDEPTGHLDPATEAAVDRSIRRLASGRTVVVAAHRPALLLDASRVVRLDGSDELVGEANR